VIATYVIGLREGLEAALIVGIVAAFLRQQGHRHALRAVWIGVIIAILFCAAVGVALQILNQALPQRQQEMLETVVGLSAVVIVTFMVVWMRRHARGLKAPAAHRHGDLPPAVASSRPCAATALACHDPPIPAPSSRDPTPARHPGRPFPATRIASDRNWAQAHGGWRRCRC
jgi:high-affinity iron transporter